MVDMLVPKELERVMKGCANHRRIQILLLLRKEPELTLDQISTSLDIDFRVASEHIRRLATGELVLKRYAGRYVHHALTSRAKNILTFLGKLE